MTDMVLGAWERFLRSCNTAGGHILQQASGRSHLPYLFLVKPLPFGALLYQFLLAVFQLGQFRWRESCFPGFLQGEVSRMYALQYIIHRDGIDTQQQLLLVCGHDVQSSKASGKCS